MQQSQPGCENEGEGRRLESIVLSGQSAVDVTTLVAGVAFLPRIAGRGLQRVAAAHLCEFCLGTLVVVISLPESLSELAQQSIVVSGVCLGVSEGLLDLLSDSPCKVLVDADEMGRLVLEDPLDELGRSWAECVLLEGRVASSATE